MISVGMKLHFLSFIEYNLGTLKTAIIYSASCIGGIIFQTIFTNDPGYYIIKQEFVVPSILA